MPTQKSGALRTLVISKLNSIFPGVAPLPRRLLQVNNSKVNVRVSAKPGFRHWFDVSWGLLKDEDVDFFVYACGNQNSMYVFPKHDFERLMEHASSGGVKLIDPNFTIFSDTHQLEPAGRSDLKTDIRQYYNNFNLIPSTKKDQSHPPMAGFTPRAIDIEEPPQKHKSTTYRILRDTVLSHGVKRVHNFRCQLCHHEGLQLGEGKLYAEVHHIKPLGAPHNGLDVDGNVLCVCPNCHVLFDYGAVKIDLAKLETTPNHIVSEESVRYHNTAIFGKLIGAE